MTENGNQNNHRVQKVRYLYDIYLFSQLVKFLLQSFHSIYHSNICKVLSLWSRVAEIYENA